MSDTFVSVVMPMKNARAYVDAAARSVLQERDVKLELVVVDDGSSDDSRTIVLAIDDPRLRVIDGPCEGFSKCLNAGFAASRGEVLMQCDADDLFEAGRIRHQLTWLDAHEDFDALAGSMTVIDNKGLLVAIPPVTDGSWIDISDELRRGVVRTSLCTYGIRRRVLDRVGLLRPYFETSPDLDFQFRMGERCRVAYDPQNTYFYRLHADSITHTQSNSRRIFFEQTARAFQLERLETGSDALSRGSPPRPPVLAEDKPNPVSSQIQGMLVGQAWRHLKEGNRLAALGSAWRAIRHGPSNVSAWRALVLVSLVRISRRR